MNINFCIFIAIAKIAKINRTRKFPVLQYIYQIWRPDQSGIATILPCLFVHNLVFDTNDLKFELS